MKVQEFLDQVQQLLLTTDDVFAFETPGDMSGFLHGFRSFRRHSGDYKDGVWTMVRAKGRCPVEMRVGREATVVSRSSLLEIANIVVDEVNDMLLCEYGPTAKLYERVCVEGHGPQVAVLGKLKMWAAIAVPVMITVLALVGFDDNGSEAALRQIVVSAVGFAAFVAIIAMRPKLSLMKVAPWMLGGVTVAIVCMAIGGLCMKGISCWLLLGIIPFWVAWLRVKFTKVPTGSLAVLVCLVGLIVCNCLLLSDGMRRRNLLAFLRGEQQIEEQAKLEQSRWKQAMCESAWFGSTEGLVTQDKRTTRPVAQLVEATQRHGKWFPLTVCALFLALSAIIVVPLFRNHYDYPIRLFGVLAALWLAAPVLLTVSAAYMLVPAANLPVPFVSCGFETVFAWVVVALVVAGQHTGRERMPVDGVLMPIYGRKENNNAKV